MLQLFTVFAQLQFALHAPTQAEGKVESGGDVVMGGVILNVQDFRHALSRHGRPLFVEGRHLLEHIQQAFQEAVNNKTDLVKAIIREK